METHSIGPINAIKEIKIQVDFEPLKLFDNIRYIALKLTIIDQKHKTINMKIKIGYTFISSISECVFAPCMTSEPKRCFQHDGNQDQDQSLRIP